MGVLAADNPWRLTRAIELYFIAPSQPSEVILLHIAVEGAVLIHNPADDIGISVVWWVGTEKVFCHFD